MAVTELTESEREELDRLRAAAATPAPESGLKLVVSPKGCVMVTGLWDKNAGPTLYKDQWRRLMAEMDTIEDFIVAHDAKLKTYK